MKKHVSYLFIFLLQLIASVLVKWSRSPQGT